MFRLIRLFSMLACLGCLCCAADEEGAGPGGDTDVIRPDGSGSGDPMSIGGDVSSGDPMTTGGDSASGDSAGTGGDAAQASGDSNGSTGCPPPPAGVSADAHDALALTNELRSAMQIPCATMNTKINLAAEKHCDYYAANSGNCVANAHKEVAGCDLYVAVNFWERMAAAGYSGNAAFEDMAYAGDGQRATQQWIDSIWHRTPILSPWVRDLGYGKASGCDTMDFGVGAATANDVVATYPYAGQVGVPPSFSGNEGPPPPEPSTGWPSGYPIHVYAKNATISTHTLTVDGDSTPIAHVWLSPTDSGNPGTFLANEHVMYANDSLARGTTYRVQVQGTHTGGALNLSWTFTTR